MNIVVPMAANSQAFKDKGHLFCKSLVEIRGKPMIERVWECLLPIKADRHVFIIRKDDARQSHLDHVLKLMDPACTVVLSDAPTGGAVCTVLLAIDALDPEKELIVANGDQLLLFDVPAVIRSFRKQCLDAGTVVFDSVHPRWSFVRVDEQGMVTEASEKRPISRHATAGFYYFRRAADFIAAAFRMIAKDAHVGGSFYVCPVLNEMVLNHARIGTHSIDRDAYVSLANPQNVEEYEQRLSQERTKP